MSWELLQTLGGALLIAATLVAAISDRPMATMILACCALVTLGFVVVR